MRKLWPLFLVPIVFASRGKKVERPAPPPPVVATSGVTEFSFILGVVPLVLATGAGAEIRLAMEVAVFSGNVDAMPASWKDWY